MYTKSQLRITSYPVVIARAPSCNVPNKTFFCLWRHHSWSRTQFHRPDSWGRLHAPPLNGEIQGGPTATQCPCVDVWWYCHWLQYLRVRTTQEVSKDVVPNLLKSGTQDVKICNKRISDEFCPYNPSAPRWAPQMCNRPFALTPMLLFLTYFCLCKCLYTYKTVCGVEGCFYMQHTTSELRYKI